MVTLVTLVKVVSHWFNEVIWVRATGINGVTGVTIIIWASGVRVTGSFGSALMRSFWSGPLRSDHGDPSDRDTSDPSYPEPSYPGRSDSSPIDPDTREPKDPITPGILVTLRPRPKRP